MKEDLKTILYVGLGALSETNEKISDVKDDLYTKGKELYEKGIIANEELKHNISEAIKERVTVVNVNKSDSKVELLKKIDKLSQEDKREILEALSKEEWNDAKNDKGNEQ